MIRNIALGFRNICNFKGRTTQSEFWPFFGTSIGLFIPLNFATAIYVFISAAMLDREARGGNFSGLTNAAQDEKVVEAIIETLFHAMAIPPIVIMLLLTAATVRRLHDVGKSGILVFSFWLILIVHIALLTFGGPIIVSNPQLKMLAQIVLWSASAYEIFVVVILFLALVRESEPFDNAFGPNPYPLNFEPLKKSIASIGAPARTY
jgi:uncharacterized membrane protein YhaH (DUF805 family)